MDFATPTNWSCDVADSEKRVQASREGLTSLTVWLDPNIRKALKQAALDHDVTVQDLVAAGLREVLDSPAKFVKRIKQGR